MKVYLTFQLVESFDIINKMEMTGQAWTSAAALATRGLNTLTLKPLLATSCQDATLNTPCNVD